MREDDDFGDELAAPEEGGEEESSVAKLPWDGSDRDYAYDELLGKVSSSLFWHSWH